MSKKTANEAVKDVVEMKPEAGEQPAPPMPEFNANEWAFINQSVENIQVQGKDALGVAMLLKKLDDVRLYLVSTGEVEG